MKHAEATSESLVIVTPPNSHMFLILRKGTLERILGWISSLHCGLFFLIEVPEVIIGLCSPWCPAPIDSGFSCCQTWQAKQPNALSGQRLECTFMTHGSHIYGTCISTKLHLFSLNSCPSPHVPVSDQMHHPHVVPNQKWPVPSTLHAAPRLNPVLNLDSQPWD